MNHNYDIIVAIDPGGRFVGEVIYYTSSGWLSNHQYDITSPTGYVPTKFNPELKVLVIIEAFKLYNDKALAQSYSSMQTPQLIGNIKNTYSNFDIIEQSASQAKNWTNERLFKLGFFRKHKNRIEVASSDGKNNIKYEIIEHHTRDAFRHLIYWLNKNMFNGMINLTKYLNFEL